MSLLNKKKAGEINIHIPCEGTIRNVMDKIGLIRKPHRKPNGITKADREAQKSDDLLKRDCSADRPLKKAVTDISEVKAKDLEIFYELLGKQEDLHCKRRAPSSCQKKTIL